MKTPRRISEFPKNTRETVRVTLDKFRGEYTIDCRVWFLDEETGKFKRSRNGITLSTRLLPALVAGTKQALAKARKAGLLDSGSANRDGG